ncbi:MAG: hypothetical protein KGI75_00775 [Rhizobiaceae bacterium]|nr:hypothetical protein [Rhizobiaceae bacterium]
MGHIAALFVFFVICVAIIVANVGHHNLDRQLKAILALAILLALSLIPMLALFIRLLWRLDYATPVLTISPQGFQDIRIAKGFIPWDSVSELKFSRAGKHGGPFLTCYLTPESENILNVELVRKIWTSENRYSRPTVYVEPGVFDMEFSKIWEIMDTFYGAYKSGHVAEKIDQTLFLLTSQCTVAGCDQLGTLGMKSRAKHPESGS